MDPTHAPPPPSPGPPSSHLSPLPFLPQRGRGWQGNLSGRRAPPAATAGGERPLASPSQGQGGRGEEGGRKGRGDKWGEGGPGLGGGGAWVGSMHHPLPWLPPQRYAKIGSF
jgi:hypothetical protein